MELLAAGSHVPCGNSTDGTVGSGTPYPKDFTEKMPTLTPEYHPKG